MNFGAPTPVEVAIDGPGLRGEPDVCGQGPRRARADSDAPRSAVRPGARLPGDSGGREPPDGRAARRHRRPGRPIVCRGDLVEPVRRAELLGGSAHRHRVPGPGRGAAAADDQPRRSARHAGERRSALASAARRRGAHREQHDRRRIRSRERSAHGDADGERGRRRSRPHGRPRGRGDRAGGDAAARRRGERPRPDRRHARDLHEHHRRSGRGRRRRSSCCWRRTSSRCVSRSSWSPPCRPFWPASS